MSNVEYIKDFLTKMSTQDNRSTRAPYFYVIMDGYDQILPEGHGGDDKYYYPELENSFDSKEEARKYATEYSDKEFEDLECREYSSERKFVEKQMFLTEEDAQSHFKLNRYHYSHDAYIFLKHSFRAVALETFFNALFDEYGIERWKT